VGAGEPESKRGQCSTAFITTIGRTAEDFDQKASELIGRSISMAKETLANSMDFAHRASGSGLISKIFRLPPPHAQAGGLPFPSGVPSLPAARMQPSVDELSKTLPPPRKLAARDQARRLSGYRSQDRQAGEALQHGIASFDRIRYRRHDADLFMWAFDVIELNGVVPSTRTSVKKKRAQK
jgi:hypothetical protein